MSEKTVERLARTGRMAEAWDAFERMAASGLAVLAQEAELWDNWVDPTTRYLDAAGNLAWTAAVGGNRAQGSPAAGIATIEELDTARTASRLDCATNPYAISAAQNRVSYLLGTGFTWRVLPRLEDDKRALKAAAEAQRVLDLVLRRNGWTALEEETLRRWDRDGEVLARRFAAGAEVDYRFVEPEDVRSPQTAKSLWGVERDASDAARVKGYWVNGVLVPAAEIRHLKQGVDGNVDRGIPLFYAVHVNLERAAKILRNASIVIAIQAAFAALCRYDPALLNAGTAPAWTAKNADQQVTDPLTGALASLKRVRPGSMVAIPQGLAMEFPTVGSGGGSIAVLQAELRAVAAHMTMPEYMLSADASNANYASTLAAEAPATKRFRRDQATLGAFWEGLLWDAFDAAIAAGTLDQATRDLVALSYEAPPVEARNQFQETQRNSILRQNGVLSVQTWCAREDLVYEDEQKNIEAGMAPQTELPLPAGEDGEDEGANAS